MVRRHNVEYFLDGIDKEIDFASWGRLVAATTVGFDISVLELFLPISRGGTAILADDLRSKSGEALLRLAAGRGRCLIQAMPTMWRMISSAAAAADGPGADGVGVLCGGEALPYPLAEELYERFEAVWNLYGPTETTIWSFAHRFAARDFSYGDGIVPIGRPLAGTDFTLLVGEGTSDKGELRIEGPGVTAGYFRRPDLDASKFSGDGSETSPFAFLTGRYRCTSGPRQARLCRAQGPAGEAQRVPYRARRDREGSGPAGTCGTVGGETCRDR
ncbi:MAG: AMP-binding protein [Breoghania sp.]|nr:AMP-binding protein [Breoghania sp.]MDJ0932529.1 AMP-binding protein [Breoghania sp.]